MKDGDPQEDSLELDPELAAIIDEEREDDPFAEPRKPSSRDAEYKAAYLKWIAGLPKKERERLKALGLSEPLTEADEAEASRNNRKNAARKV